MKTKFQLNATHRIVSMNNIETPPPQSETFIDINQNTDADKDKESKLEYTRDLLRRVLKCGIVTEIVMK